MTVDRFEGSTPRRWHKQSLLGDNDVPADELGDCVRACITSILGLPLDSVENVQGDDWWQRWQEFVGGYGYELLVIYPKNMAAPPEGLWLCVVPSLALDGNHCVVARGRELFHDPGMKRRYSVDEWAALWEADRVLEGWLLVPRDPAVNLMDAWQAVAETMQRIKDNAEAWHGVIPEGNEPGAGHARALAVIAEWAADALARLAEAEKAQTPQ